MNQIIQHAENLWTNGATAAGTHPWRALGTFERIRDGVWFASSFANLTLIDGGTELLVIDPGAKNNEERKFKQIIDIFPDTPVSTIVYTHGHHDHCFGGDRYKTHAKENNLLEPMIIGHQALGYRFDRYAKTTGFNEIINARQFLGGAANISWKAEYTRPDLYVDNYKKIRVGNIEASITHSRGETDDSLWLHVPEYEALCTGDLFIWTAPNAGNPQKVQRYCGEWAAALGEMQTKNASVLLPGHGPPIIGKDRVEEALDCTRRYLESLEAQTLQLMNLGASLDEVLAKVKPPEELSQKFFLQPVYDEPEFIVRNIWRLYGGWYDGQASNLKPPREESIAHEIINLISGGTKTLMERAQILSESGQWRLACKLADWAHHAAPNDPDIKLFRGKLYQARTNHETSTMTIGIYNSIAREMGVEMKDQATFSAQEEKTNEK